MVLLLLFALLFLSPRAQAQLVSDGGTATINGTTNNLGGDLTVGTNGGNTTLILTNGAVVNSGNALIGLNAGATNNLVAVSGTGSRLTTAGGLSVFRIGNGGAFNRLLISQGGAVSNGYGVIGYLAGASNNSVLVTDAGSAWTNNVLYLGENGSGNSLTIANAGRVVANDSTIGLVAGASNNSAVVTGTNSLWSTAGTLLVGDAGGGSRLWVNRGGAVASTGLVLGNQSTSGGNLLSLAGANSALTVTNGGGTGTLDVRRGVVELNGGTLTADRLLLTNGAGSFSFNDGTLITRSATISNGQAFVVGRSSNALPLSPVLLNATSMTLPGSGTAGPASIYPSVINVTNVGGPITKLTVTLGGFSHSYPRDLDIMLVGPAGQKVMLMSDVGGVNPGISSVNLTFDDAAGVAVPDINPPTGASYRPTDAAPGDPFPYPMPAGPYSTNLSDFNGTSANGAWSLYVVDDASGDSGSLSSWGLQITTAGPAATWDVRSNAVPTTLANDLLLGSTASSATLLVTNGATLHVNGFSSLGTEAGSTNNRAIIAGPNSFWTNSGVLVVGAGGSFNTVHITNGGRMAGDGILGNFSNANHNQVIVTGSNSVWSGGNIVVGGSGSSNTLSLTDGGTVQATNALVGFGAGATNNVLSVSHGLLLVTNADGSALLEVRRGSVVLEAGLIVTDQLRLTNSEGSFTFNDGTLITRSATLSNGQDFLVGANAGTGPAGTAFANGTLTTLTDNSPASPYPSVINVSNVVGAIAKVTVTLSNLTHTYPADLDILLVGPAGQKVMLMSDVGGGSPGVGGLTLTFDDAAGAGVPASNPSSGTYLPTDAAPSDVFPPLAPAGPYSTSLADFNGGGANGAWSLYIVDDVGGDSGTLGAWSLNLVMASAATWDLRSNALPTVVGNGLIIGSNAANATLLVTNGATLAAGPSLIPGFGMISSMVGWNAGSTNNRAIIAGPGSRWTNSHDLVVGVSGSGNQLVMSNGGVVASVNGSIGLNLGASNNVALVAGAGSHWTNSGELYVGAGGSGNQLMVSSAGVVTDSIGYVGTGAGASNNVAWITGAGSLWTNRFGLHVGYFGSGNQLVVSNGGRVVSTAGFIGSNSVANGNRVTVTGTNSVWTISGELQVGNEGSGNELMVTSGGVVAGSVGVLGFLPAASNNVAVVTGAGSRWANSGSLTVGKEGGGNRLVVSNGGVVAGLGGTLGVMPAGSNNVAVVTGPGSLWSNVTSLVAGLFSSGNQLVVSNGGRVMNAAGCLGYYAGANNNAVTVTGTNSLWTNSGELYVGREGGGNQLMVSDGGTVTATNVTVGVGASSTGNRVTVHGGTMRVTNAGGNATLEIRRGTNVLNAGLIVADRLLLTSNAGFFTFNGGTLVTRSGTLSNGQDFVVGAAAGFDSATWDVRSNAVPTVLARGLVLGANAANATLLVTNGATLSVGGAAFNSAFSSGLGLTAGSTNNRAIVAGPSSVWTNSRFLGVGFSGSFNSLLITNGGRVASDFGYLGFNATASNNLVTVTGSNSVWANGQQLIVGDGGENNQLLVLNGGAVFNTDGFVGGGSSGANNNSVTVSGPGSLWSNSFNAKIGNLGSGNTLLIADGGTVADIDGYLGVSAGANHNQATVTGTNSLWTNSGNFFVGHSGASNALLIANGGRVENVNGYLGLLGGSGNNQVTVTGPGSLWNNSEWLLIGQYGDANTLLIADGGTVADLIGYAGFAGSNNQVTVTGSNSLWINRDELHVGWVNAYNTLLITNGGRVVTSNGYVGFDSDHNQAIVTGTHSFLTNSGDLNVGYFGSFNTLRITNGGAVQAANAYVSFATNSSNNLLRLDNGLLTVTNTASNAVLDVRRGSVVFNGGTITADRLLLTNGAQSQFTFNAGTLNVRSATVSNSALFTVGNGTSNATYRMSGATNNVHSFASNLLIATNATLTGNGAILGTVTNFGTIAPGDSAGSLTINGNLRLQSSSMMSFELGGLIATNQYDQLTVTNFLEFAGTLSLQLINGFLPAAGDTFTLFKFGSFGGQFANAPSLGRVSLSNNLASFAVTYSLTNLVIGGVIYPDSDGDGQTDIKELAAGTDPNNSASAMRITSITQNGSGYLVVQFQSVAGKNYRIEYSNDLATWSTATLSVPATGASTQWIDDGSLTGGLNFLITRRYYRVGLQ